MEFPVHCQTRGQRVAHALWLFWDGVASSNDLARLIDAEFPPVLSEVSEDLATPTAVIAATLHRIDPQMTGMQVRAARIAQDLRDAGWELVEADRA